MKKALTLAVAILAMASSLYAADVSLFGPTGLGMTPTDNVAEKGELALGATYVDTGNQGFLGNTHAWSASANYGLINNLEVGVNYFDFHSSIWGGEDDFMFNAKYRIFNEDKYGFGLAVGVADITAEYAKNPSFYAVAGKTFGGNVRATVGFGSKIYKGLFIGVDWNATEKFDVFAEYINEYIGGGDDAFNLGVGYKFGKLGVKAGLMDMDDLFVGVNYNLTLF
ncbi:MAG: YjbH domain-containing protein [Abditibacteriota bacterium]|nr:YjbH domain-containing protein [Abditibacteriota bacterium]